MKAVFEAKLPFSSQRADSMTRSSLGLIARTLKNKDFRQILKTILEPRYEIASRKYFTEKIHSSSLRWYHRGKRGIQEWEFSCFDSIWLLNYQYTIIWCDVLYYPDHTLQLVFQPCFYMGNITIYRDTHGITMYCDIIKSWPMYRDAYCEVLVNTQPV